MKLLKNFIQKQTEDQISEPQILNIDMKHMAEEWIVTHISFQWIGVANMIYQLPCHQ